LAVLICHGTATSAIYTLSLHDALPICRGCQRVRGRRRMPDDVWLPDPPDGIYVAGGFDGSDNDDFTCIKLETREGYVFTPRYGPDRRPTIWNPAEWGGRIPRSEV